VEVDIGDGVEPAGLLQLFSVQLLPQEESLTANLISQSKLIVSARLTKRATNISSWMIISVTNGALLVHMEKGSTWPKMGFQSLVYLAASSSLHEISSTVNYP
jgi:hypothetical protein